MIFCQCQEALTARRLQSTTLPFPTCSNTLLEEACASGSIEYDMRTRSGSQGCREKSPFQQIKQCSCVVILQNNPDNLYLVAVHSEGINCFEICPWQVLCKRHALLLIPPPGNNGTTQSMASSVRG